MKNLLVVCFAIMLVVTACQKDPVISNPVTDTTTGDDTSTHGTTVHKFDFSYTGDLFLLSPVTFTADLTTKVADKDVIWDFGDGTLDTGNVVMHSFMYAGSNKVNMHVKGPKDTVVEKSIIFELDVNMLSGVRHWTGYTGNPAGTFPVSGFDAEVILINDSTVEFYSSQIVMHGEKITTQNAGEQYILTGINIVSGSVRKLEYFPEADTFAFLSYTRPVETTLTSTAK